MTEGAPDGNPGLLSFVSEFVLLVVPFPILVVPEVVLVPVIVVVVVVVPLLIPPAFVLRVDPVLLLPLEACPLLAGIDGFFLPRFLIGFPGRGFLRFSRRAGFFRLPGLDGAAAALAEFGILRGLGERGERDRAVGGIGGIGPLDDEVDVLAGAGEEREAAGRGVAGGIVAEAGV